VRGQEVIDTRTGSADGGTECPNIVWFWVAAAVVGLGAIAKGNK